MKGKLITFEGPEGGGKSTHARALAERLRSRGIAVVLTREPGGTPTGEAIREILQHDRAGEPLCDRAEVLLFNASRAQLVHRVIQPALARGAWVLCDRFVDSTLAYQGHARGIDLETLERLNAFATHAQIPDLTLLLDIDVERGFRRVRERNRVGKLPKDRIENESLAFHRRIRDGYLALCRAEPERVVRIDSDRAAEQVAREIWRVVAERFRLDAAGEDAGHAR